MGQSVYPFVFVIPFMPGSTVSVSAARRRFPPIFIQVDVSPIPGIIFVPCSLSLLAVYVMTLVPGALGS